MDIAIVEIAIWIIVKFHLEAIIRCGNFVCLFKTVNMWSVILFLIYGWDIKTVFILRNAFINRA